MQSGIHAWLLLLRNCSPAVAESDRIAVELGAPVEEGAVLGDAGGALLGCTGGNNLVPLGGHHGQVQALLDGPAASGVAVQAVGDGGNDLVGAFRGSGKKAYGHGTFTPVGELVLANTHLTIHIHAGSCCWGWSPGAMTGGGSLVRQSPALCGALSFLRDGEALHCCPGWGWVLLPGGTKFGCVMYCLRSLIMYSRYILIKRFFLAGKKKANSMSWLLCGGVVCLDCRQPFMQ